MLPRRVVRIGSYLLLSTGLVLLVTAQLAPSSFFFARLAGSRTAAEGPATAQRAALQADYGRLPISFEPNMGQAGAATVHFLARGAGYTLLLTESGATLSLSPSHPLMTGQHLLPGMPGPLATSAAATTPPATVGMAWLGANAHPAVTGEEALPGTVNEFFGNDPARWHTNIPTYQQVRLHNVYPGVDLVYYGTGGQLEYDFVVAPGADPSRVALGFSGAEHVGVDLAGNLHLQLPGGVVQQDHPAIYQTVNGARQTVPGGYLLGSHGRVNFTHGAYNPHLPLVIDPVFRYSTYFGGSGNNLNDGLDIALDSAGNAYFTGATTATNFPTHNPIQSTFGGNGPNGLGDAFVVKLNAAGTAVLYSTYLGGSSDDEAASIAVDSAGDAYLAGQTTSTNFPVVNAFQSTNHGGNYDGNDAWVAKINPAGSALIYSTYLGGIYEDAAYAITADNAGDAYVTGYTKSYDFPVTVGAYQTSNASMVPAQDDAFVTEFNPTGSALVFSTYLGGTQDDQGNGIAVDGSGNVYIAGDAGQNFPTTVGAFQTTSVNGYGGAFVTKLNAAGTALIYSTYLSANFAVYGNDIAINSAGNAYVVGTTAASNFPVLNAVQNTNGGGNYDAFVTEFNTAGTGLVYSTYLGGSLEDGGHGIAVDSTGSAYVTGYTYSTNFPTTDPLQATNTDTPYNTAFVARFSASGTSLLYSSYLGGSHPYGGSGNGVAVNIPGTVYVVGFSSDTDFPLANAIQSTGPGITVSKIFTRPNPITTTGVFRPSNGALYLKNVNSTGFADITLTYGLPGDKPVTGDWTGKGYPSIGVDRGGTFLLRNTNTTGYADITLAFGNSTDLPVAGDWTGKGYDSIGVFRNGAWYLRNSNTTGSPDISVHFGTSGDLPVVGDWTGKGYDSIGIFRPSTGTFYLRNSNTTGVADITVHFGANGDLPVVGDWTAHGYDSVGVERVGNFLLRNTNTTGPADINFYLGVSGDQPIAGPWLAPAGSVPSHLPAHGDTGGSPAHALWPTLRSSYA